MAERLIFLILLIHLILSLLLLLLAVFRALNLRPAAFFTILLVPLFGPLSALIFGISKRINKDAGKDVEVAKFLVEDEIYRSLGYRDDGEGNIVALEEAMVLNASGTRRTLLLDLVKENVVPLEEALSMSTSNVRRKLMMDILTGNTVSFYSLLEEARLNDDVEVVHYATTAMAELNTKYDLLLAQCMEQYEKTPEDLDTLIPCCDCHKQYLSLGLVRGQMEKLRREEYIRLLAQLIEREPVEWNYADLAIQQLQLADFERANETISLMEERWPVRESTWLLRLEYHARQGDGASVKRLVQNAYASGVYFSQRARERLQFWSQREAME